ncbi:uncharacterized protein CC84DRAFT_1204042, partial [Paraphaeosphaeria sporulosa]
MDSYLHRGLPRAMMEKGKVIRLDITSSQSCQSHEITWDELLQGLRAAPVQVIFTSTNSFLSTVPGFQKELKSTLKIHQFFFDRIYLQSNGFCGHEVWLDDNEKVECYTYWSRFTVKQTYDKLRAKRTYTPHISNHHSGAGDWNADVAIHGPQSVRHGWEWYEMGFFASWTPSGSITLLCFDLPVTLEKDIQSMFCSQGVSRWCPYAVFSLVSDALLRLYDDSVWTVRNHISQWEARRSQEADYILLHEIARHGIHISETLSVAIRSLDAMQHHHAKFRTYNDLVRSKKGCENWDRVGTHFEFQLRFLQGLFQRSEANNARIQNEITLAFNVAAQRDSRIQLQIGEEAKREASAMKAIAVVTMTFLPATFISTIFGSNFFSFEPDGGAGQPSFTVSHQFWIYWALSVPLTAVTLALWFWWSRWVEHLRLSRFRAVAP